MQFGDYYPTPEGVKMASLLNVGDILGRNARLFPDVKGAQDLERSISYKIWNERACRLANALKGLGLAKGDRVAILAYNCLEWVEIYTATAKAGLVAVPINFRLVAQEIRYIIENCEAAALIVQDELLSSIEAVRPDLPIPSSNYIYFGKNVCPAGYRPYEDFLAFARD